MPCFLFLFFWPLTLLPIPLLYATCFYVSSIHIGQQSTFEVWHTSQYSDITVVPQTLLCLKIRNYLCVSLRESYIGLLISDHWSINTNFIDWLHASFWTCSLLKWCASTVTPLFTDSSIIWTPGIKTHVMICASLVTLFKRFDCTWVGQYRQHPVNEKPRAKTMFDY